ncbi:MAG: bis(5'-nucleosyl)-tetraphosphatase (symmetrical) YqeK [Lachnospiraceae bacterium]|nr:bis(5'-nucleosyl)-tetraphosphatase (symmetrical) YqeK [Lachnospiraceae bacterium]
MTKEEEGALLSRERIGILRSTFDPIHQGHLQMAENALNQYSLDHLLVIPSADDVSKPCIASGEDRWKMVVTACTQDRRLIPSRMELDQKKAPFAADTLAALKKEYPKAALFYIVRLDEVMKLRYWSGLKKAFSCCSFLVFVQAGEVIPPAVHHEINRLHSLGGSFSMIRTEPVSGSSAEFRNHLASAHPFPDLFSPVWEYCNLTGLYGFSPHSDRAEEWIDKLFSDLNPRRFSHSLSVADCARHLAQIHHIDLRQAEEAGLLHDCAKCLPLKEMQCIAIEHSLTDDPTILSSSALMHSLVGAWVARNKYGMADPEVLEAISYHNTGHAGMSRLAMCVCLADSIEPTREHYPLLEQVQSLSELSLERALLLSLETTADFVRQRGKYLHPLTQNTIAWLKTLPAVRVQKA